MEIQSWIIGQIAIDIIIAALLIWFILSQIRKKDERNDFEASLLKAEGILSEMREVTQVLGINLEDKRVLGNRILEQLDEGLRKADESRGQLQKIIKQCSTNMTDRTSTLNDTDQTRSSVNALLEKGMSRIEISQHLGISLGEIDLLLKLQV